MNADENERLGVRPDGAGVLCRRGRGGCPVGWWGRRGWVALSLAWQVMVGLHLGAGQARGQVPGIPEPAKAGREIAERLRKAGPEKSARFDGWMTITRRGWTNAQRIWSRVEVTPTNWLIRYVAGSNSALDTLTVVHTPGRPNEYYAGQGTNGGSYGSRLSERDLYQPFAGSDFWRIDLGLDFLWWPSQRHVANEMRRGQDCDVLESRHPQPVPGGYLRVKSWVDTKHDGILLAEAYDEQDRRLKQFKVGSFRKVDGYYHLEEMTMSRAQGGGETRIRFDLER